MKVADVIREARKKKKLTQEELAEKADVSRSTIARVERGDEVSLSTLAKISKVLDLELILR